MRPLTPTETQALELNGCRCADWSLVSVADPFRPSHYRDVSFSGRVSLGTTDGTVMREGRIPMAAGIYSATIHNCTVADDVLINRIGNYIADYPIGRGTVIENTACGAMTGTSSFGNGTEVSVLNETGGREVPICDCLSAHVAYIIAMYRHDKALTDRLGALIADYAA